MFISCKIKRIKKPCFCPLPLGNGAYDFPQPFLTISTSSDSTRWSSESDPQKKGTLPSASWIEKRIIRCSLLFYRKMKAFIRRFSNAYITGHTDTCTSSHCLWRKFILYYNSLFSQHSKTQVDSRIQRLDSYIYSIVFNINVSDVSNHI